MSGMQWITTTQILEDLVSSNDALAWNSFRDHFYPVVVNFAKRLGLSSTYAEDAAQETMLSFLKAFRDGRYNREKGRLGSWVFGVARRVILNFRKRLPREHVIADNSTGTSFWDMIADANAVKHTWETEWRRSTLRTTMPGRFRLSSRVLHGCSSPGGCPVSRPTWLLNKKNSSDSTIEFRAGAASSGLQA